MYLTYWDDSGTDGRSDLLVFGGVVIPANSFRNVETIHAHTVRELIPPDRTSEFQEFHAFELMNGQGVFEGIPFEKRRIAMATLLVALTTSKVPYYYCAVDKTKLQGTAAGSAEPMDVGFRMCLFALREWADGQWKIGRELTQASLFVDHVMTHGWPGLCLVVVDDCDRDKRRRLKETFRHFRTKEYARAPGKPIDLLHDAMYFGDSTDAVGLQIADACNWVMRRHLSGLEDYGLFNMLKPNAFAAMPEPDWSMLKSALKRHDDE